jgi:hypothetical protein
MAWYAMHFSEKIDLMEVGRGAVGFVTFYTLEGAQEAVSVRALPSAELQRSFYKLNPSTLFFPSSSSAGTI